MCGLLSIVEFCSLGQIVLFLMWSKWTWKEMFKWKLEVRTYFIFPILPCLSRPFQKAENSCLLLRQKVITTQITQQQNEIYSHWHLRLGGTERVHRGADKEFQWTFCATSSIPWLITQWGCMPNTEHQQANTTTLQRHLCTTLHPNRT